MAQAKRTIDCRAALGPYPRRRAKLARGAFRPESGAGGRVDASIARNCMAGDSPETVIRLGRTTPFTLRGINSGPEDQGSGLIRGDRADGLFGSGFRDRPATQLSWR